VRRLDAAFDGAARRVALYAMMAATDGRPQGTPLQGSGGSTEWWPQSRAEGAKTTADSRKLWAGVRIVARVAPAGL